MPEDQKFEEDLRRVFGNRADQMSDDAVSLLRELWDAGRDRIVGLELTQKQTDTMGRALTAMGVPVAEALQAFNRVGQEAPGEASKVGSVTEYLQKVDESYK